MFGRKRGAEAEPLPSVGALNEVVANIERRAGELETLRQGLRNAMEETDRLLVEEQAQRDAMYRHAARALVQPELQAEADRCHERMQACAQRRVELEPQKAAIEREIGHTEAQLTNLRGERAHAKRTAWEEVFHALATRFSDEQREHFVKMWTALDQMHNGAPAVAVLHRLGIVDVLDTGTKLQLIDQLSDTYGIPTH